MECVFALLLSFLLVSSNVSAEVISIEPDGVVCLNAVTYICMVNETNRLGWRYGGPGGATRLYLSPSGPGSFETIGSSPFSSRVTSVSGGIITSIATASNLTRDADGMTLECSDGLFSSSSTKIEGSELNFGDFMTPYFDLSNSNTTINIVSTNECNPMRKTDVFNEAGFVESITWSSALLSYTPPQLGPYTFNVSNMDANGQIIASNSFNFNWNIPDFTVDDTIYYSYTISSNILSIRIKAASINQPKMLTCDVTLMEDNGNNNVTSCFDREVREVVSFPISDRTNYTYNVTITNALGSSNRNMSDELVDFTFMRPTVTTTIGFTSIIEPSLSPEPSECDNTNLVIIFAVPLGVFGLWFILSILWCILYLCWRHCYCCLTLWTLSTWRYVFCECFRKESKPDENIVSLKKDESNL